MLCPKNEAHGDMQEIPWYFTSVKIYLFQKKDEEYVEPKERPYIVYNIDYIGGHGLFPKDNTRAKMGLFADRTKGKSSTCYFNDVSYS
jgi:hypothetical protein